uniref:Lipid body protein n=1 Tax=Lobosphaera incisa TaxID=312850 RepID=A0A1X9QDR8_9CHLO|nr:lipid body protein [Lobosphaera incisa]
MASAVATGLAAAGGTVLGVLRTLLGLVRSLVTRKPFRIDIPLPLLPVDIVIVQNPAQIQAINKSPACGRLHAVPTSQMPKWVQLYFSATRFHDDRKDTWFIPFEAEVPATHAAARRSTISRLLASGHTQDDVYKVAKIVRAGGDLEKLADYLVPMVNSRFIDGKPIPKPAIDAARTALNSIGDAIRPGNYQTAHQGMHELGDFCTAAITLPPEQLKPMDVAHNMSAVACSFTKAVLTLKANPTTPIDQLFTIPRNLPTPNIPRIAVASSTCGDLLAYPTVPNKTIFLLSLASAAGATKSLFYTFGSGTPERSCAFKPFFEAFMSDLQKELVRQGPPAKKAV